MDKMNNINSFTQGTKDALPLLMAIAPYAIILGAQASRSGLTLAETGMMTALNFAGGSEFAAIQIWHEPFPVLTIILMTFLINSRHIIMGAALTPYIKHFPRRKILPALFFMADEGWAVTYAKSLKNAAHLPPEKSFNLAYYFGACFPFYPVWVGFSVVGFVAGPILGNIEQYGFAIAFPATFIVLLRSMWKGLCAARPWLVSLIVAAVTYRMVPGHTYVLAGTFCGIFSAWLWGMKKK